MCNLTLTQGIKETQPTFSYLFYFETGGVQRNYTMEGRTKIVHVVLDNYFGTFNIQKMMFVEVFF